MELKQRIICKRVNRQLSRLVKSFSDSDLTLGDWQIDGIRWMLHREQDHHCRGGFLLDDMGLGKTIETIGLMIGNKVKRTLLILPSSLINQWCFHLKRYDPDVKIIMHYGGSRLTSSWELPDERLIVLTSYDLTYHRKSVSSFDATVLHKIDWDRIICDECHLIRNFKCKRTIGINQLSGGIRWGLTGTPIHNGEMDFVNLFRFQGYKRDYILKNLDILRDNYTLRRTKKMIGGDLELPKMSISIHRLDFSSDEEREFYRRVRGEVTRDFSRLTNMKFNMTAVFELLMRSRQSCIYPQMVLNGYNKKYDTNIEDWSGSVTKIQKLADMIKFQKNDYPNDRTLVFSYFKDEMKLLRDYLNKLGYNVSIIDGSVSLSDRDNILQGCHFNLSLLENSHFSKLPMEICNKIMEYYNPVDVLIVQINTGSTGLNLQMFNHVYFTSPCWNPAIEDQAICRSYRLGQKKEVKIHKLVMTDCLDEENKTIEEKILLIQEKKRKVMFDILKDGELLNNGLLSDAKMMENRLSVEDFVFMLG
jgi:SNF2 family DNA or RNA helicase